MSAINRIVERAGRSQFHLWMLNRLMSRVVPFNAPHGLRIQKIATGSVTVLLPYKKRNLNHIGGMHACALAVLSEYVVGIGLVSRLGDKQYRYIMKNLSMQYHFQAKMDVQAAFKLDEEMLSSKIILPLENQDAVFATFETEVMDVAGNHICTGRTEWQLKKWEKVSVKS